MKKLGAILLIVLMGFAFILGSNVFISNLLMAQSCSQGTQVGGIIYVDTIWTLDNSPYILTQDFQIPSGVTLTIQAGVVVKGNSYKIILSGVLYANGTSDACVTLVNTTLIIVGQGTLIPNCISFVDVGTFNITASASNGGTISPSGIVEVEGGNDQTFLFTPNIGYYLRDVVLDGVSLGPVNSYTFKGVNSNHTINAVFSTTKTYYVTAKAGAGGEVTPSGIVAVENGDNIIFAIKANNFYQITDVKVDGVSIGPVPSYTFSNVTANHEIEATFETISYTIQVPEVVNGYISPSGTITVQPGMSDTFSITPNPDYKIKDVLVDGVSVSAVSSYTFSNITDNHTISATFEKQITQTVIVLQIGNKIMIVNGVENQLDAAPEIKNGRTFLPLRAISEAFGAKVVWLPETQGITITLGDNTIGLQIGNTSAVVNGTVMTLEAAPYIKNSRTMVPLRLIAEGLGAQVDWDGTNRTVTITYQS